MPRKKKEELVAQTTFPDTVTCKGIKCVPFILMEHMDMYIGYVANSEAPHEVYAIPRSQCDADLGEQDPS